MIFKFIFGMLISAIGFLFILKTQWFLYNFGRIPFGEKYFGGGGSRLVYKLIGILIMLFGFMYALNMTDIILKGIAKLLFAT